jgi:formylglycine-generating enzyme required for sulfatase activity
MPTKTLTPKPTATKTQTPTPLPTEITDNKSVPMVLVPASEFTMGADFYENTKPEHQVYLDEYYMDIYEVTNGRYHECVIAGVCNTPGNSGSYTRGWFYYWETEYKNYPVIYVDWLQANLYCEWRGGRLPTEAEWEKSARGEGNGPYPWGEGINSDLANFGNYPGDTTEVGSYLDGKSIYGIYDMAGNVWEWVSTLYKNYPYTANDGREEVNDPGKRVIRGGAWDNRDIYLRVFNRQDAVPSGRNFNLGFRCAKDAP